MLTLMMWRYFQFSPSFSAVDNNTVDFLSILNNQYLSILKIQGTVDFAESVPDSKEHGFSFN